MQTHSIFSSSKKSEEKEVKDKEEIIRRALMKMMKDIHKDMEKERKTLIEGGMPVTEATDLIAKKQEKLQLEALRNFEIVYKARYEINNSLTPNPNH